MTKYVLVHGSCHGGWCWKKLIPLLNRNGHNVYTPTLTGLGERSHLVNKSVGLDTHILDIVQLLEYEDLDEVILVGHSYGGLVIGGVTEKVSHRVRRLVFLDAYIPQDNKSAFNIIPGLETIYMERRLKKEGKEWLVESYTPEEFGVTDPDDVKWMSPRLSPMPWHTHDQPMRITNMNAQSLSKSFISFSEFGRSQFKSEKSDASWDYHEL
ncbi:MAG TPA: alpha/beta fold hydrolase, partial [Nitrososphaeraceae archaeon]|nr:alpha/beta fold hydrolase [Nitrososphaeraceae archaeon]